jgi:putative effector of murein hydrolase
MHCSAALTGASPSIVAASTVINGIFNYRTVPHVLNLIRVKNPMNRGITAAITGEALQVLLKSFYCK